MSSGSTIHDTNLSGPSPAARRPSHAAWLWRALPGAAVTAGLATLAIWGHSSGWSLPDVPGLAALIGKSEMPAADWCASHNVPVTRCIECNSSLLPREPDHGWCKEHGVAQCPLDHPDVAQLTTVFVPSEADRERAARGLSLMPRVENNSRCKLHQTRIQFASTEALDKAGIEVNVVRQRPLLETIIAAGEVNYDQTRTAYLASRVEGNTWRVEKNVGDKVHKGEVLALVDSSDVGLAKSEFLQAIAQLRLKQSTVSRLKPLAADKFIPGGQFTEAEAALQEAQIRVLSTQQVLVNLGLPVRADDFAQDSPERIAEEIRFLGLPNELVRTLDSDTTTSNLFPLRSPLDGVVVERKIVAGELVNTNVALFAVSDISRMSLMLDVRQEDARHVSLGQRVLFTPGGGDDEVSGAIAWISTAADPQTRTVKVRVDLPNADGRLKANSFGMGRIVLRDEPLATVVPSEAVHWDGCCHVVFVRDKRYFDADSPKYFHTRQVRTGVKQGDATEILVGLLPGEVIASKNSGMLAAQLLKSNLGAGCGCADGK